MSCEKNQPQIPKLRFPNFVDEWKNFYLNDLSEKIGDGLHSTPNYVNKSKYFFINGNNLINGNIILNNNTKCISSEEFQKYNNNLTQNTLLLSINGTIGNLSFYNDENVILGKSVAFINLKENINKFFIYYLFQTNKIKYYFKNELTGTTIKNLSLKSLKNTNIKIPSLKEQKKIGDFLSEIDNKIALMEQKLSLYQNIEKYYINYLFNNTEKWDKKKLEDIANINIGFTPSTDKYKYWDGNVKWLTVKDMESKYLQNTKRHISKEATKNKEIIKKNTLVMSFKLTIGKLGILTEDMYSNEAICNFTWKNNDINTEFMYYYLSSINIKKYGSQAAKGITLNKQTLKTIPVRIPSLEIQQNIANILSSIDKKLDLLNKLINVEKRYKRSLLQKMLI